MDDAHAWRVAWWAHVMDAGLLGVAYTLVPSLGGLYMVAVRVESAC